MLRKNLLRVLFCALVSVCSAAPGPASGQPALLAQASPSPEARIRETARRLAGFRKLLEDPDANVRLAALNEMLVSPEIALRELAFKLGFASADSEMRSLALRQRLLNARFIVLELERDQSMSQEQWERSIACYGGPQISIPSFTLDPVTGEMKSGSSQIGRLSGEKMDFRTNGAIGTMRLTADATMRGRLSYSPAITHPVKLVLQ